MRSTLKTLNLVNVTNNMICVSATQSEQRINTFRHLLQFSYFLGHKSIVIINKSDLCTQDDLNKIVGKITDSVGRFMTNRYPVIVENLQTAWETAKKFNENKRCIPIFIISCLTGKNLDLILEFLRNLEPIKEFSKDRFPSCNTLFDICRFRNGDTGQIIEGDVIK